MKTLDLTREQAIALYEEDKEIDRMSVKQAESDLSQEQKKAIKQTKKADRTVYQFKPREKKVNNEKLFLIDKLAETVYGLGGDTVEVVNPEREFTFQYNNTKYKIVLSCPRTPKK